jgi:hypothetical protein
VTADACFLARAAASSQRVYEKGVGRRAQRVDDMLARASIHTHAAITTKLP